MEKKPGTAAVLSDNLKRLMALSKVNSGPKLEKASGVSQKTINNIDKGRHDPRLSTISKIAHALGVEPYHMLVPGQGEKFMSVCLAWAKSDARGRAVIAATARATAQLDATGDDKSAAGDAGSRS